MYFLRRNVMALSATAIFLFIVVPGFGQTPSKRATRTSAQIPRMPDGKPTSPVSGRHSARAIGTSSPTMPMPVHSSSLARRARSRPEGESWKVTSSRIRPKPPGKRRKILSTA